MGQMDYRSDIYAIGAVCYELLSYQKAFEGDTAFAVIGKIVLEKPAPLADICPGVDPAIVAIVNKALEKEPAQRYQDLDEMRADIKRVAASLAAGDTPRPARRSAKRRRAARFRAVRSQVAGMGCRGGRGGRDRIRIGRARAGFAPVPRWRLRPAPRPRCDGRLPCSASRTSRGVPTPPGCPRRSRKC